MSEGCTLAPIRAGFYKNLDYELEYNVLTIYLIGDNQNNAHLSAVFAVHRHTFRIMSRFYDEKLLEIES